MKIFIQTLYPAPYRVGLFNLLNKYVDLFVVFEKAEGDKRNKEWFDKNIKFNSIILDGNKNNKKYKEVLKNIKNYDYIIAYEYSTFKSMKLMHKCIKNRIPYLINCDGAISKNNIIKDKVKTFFIKRATACLANGKSAKEYFLKYGAKEKNIYFHNFSSLYEKDIRKDIKNRKEKIELRKRLNLPYEILYISVGNFLYGKGYDLLIEAVNKLKKDNSVGFIIIGGGEKEQEYIQKIKEYGITNIHFEKFKKKDELIQYYDASDIFIFPTRGDVWGLVINEAMARGLPVISTDSCMAALELIEENKNGNIIKTDSIDELVNIINIYNRMDFYKYEEYGKVSLNKIKDYTIENIAKSHLNVLQKIYEKEE